MTGKAVLLGQAQHPDDLVAAARQHDGLGQGTLQRRGVRRVRHEVVLARQYVLRPDQLAQRVEGERHGREGTIGRGWRAAGGSRRTGAPCAEPSCASICRRDPAELLVAGLHGEEPETVQLARGIARPRRRRRRLVRDRALREPRRHRRRHAPERPRRRSQPQLPRGQLARPGRRRATRPGIDPAERVPANRTNVLVDRQRAALRARERGAGGADRAARARARAGSACAARARADDAARARRGRARAGRGGRAASSPRSSDRRCPARCATGSATAACPASPTRSSTPGCRRSTGATCRGSSRSHANARSVARLIATVSSMRSA